MFDFHYKFGRSHFLFQEELREILSSVHTGFHENCPFSLSDLIANEIVDRFFKQSSNIKFHENPSSGSRVFPMRTNRQTDRHDVANSRFLQFCEKGIKLTDFFLFSLYQQREVRTNPKQVAVDFFCPLRLALCKQVGLALRFRKCIGCLRFEILPALSMKFNASCDVTALWQIWATISEEKIASNFMVEL